MSTRRTWNIGAGRMITEGAGVEDIGQEIFDCILAVASGEPTLSEFQGRGDLEFVPWQIGATM
jgi:altronate hydrolase